MEPSLELAHHERESQLIHLIIPNKREVGWLFVIVDIIFRVADCRQTGTEAEENRTNPQGEDRLVSNQRHGEQEKISSQQPVGSDPKGAGPTKNSGRQKTRRR